MALLWIVFFLQWSFLSVHASDPAPGGRLDLAGARRLALAHSPLLQAESAALDAAAAEIQASRSAFLPTLDATGTFSRSDNPVGVFSSKLWQESFTEQDFGIDRLNRPQPRSNWQTRLILRQPIFNQGSEIIDYRLAQVGGRRAELAAEGCRQAVLYQVEADYHAVLLSGEVCGVLQAALGLARRNLDLAETRHAEGLALKSDVLAARVQATDREQELIRAENDRLLALAALNRTMGLTRTRLGNLPAMTAWRPKSKPLRNGRILQPQGARRPASPRPPRRRPGSRPGRRLSGISPLSISKGCTNSTPRTLGTTRANPGR